MKVQKLSYIGLNHEVVKENMEGSPTFVNYMNVGKDGDVVAAVYHSASPNLEKGHKEYMLLYFQNEQLMVSGMTKDQIKKYSNMRGVLCTECDTFIFSMYRHDYHSCGCANDTIVDGGKDYLRTGGKSLDKLVVGVIDLLTDKVVFDQDGQKE